MEIHTERTVGVFQLLPTHTTNTHSNPTHKYYTLIPPTQPSVRTVVCSICVLFTHYWHFYTVKYEAFDVSADEVFCFQQCFCHSATPIIFSLDFPPFSLLKTKRCKRWVSRVGREVQLRSDENVRLLSAEGSSSFSASASCFDPFARSGACWSIKIRRVPQIVYDGRCVFNTWLKQEAEQLCRCFDRNYEVFQIKSLQESCADRRLPVWCVS